MWFEVICSLNSNLEKRKLISVGAIAHVGKLAFCVVL